MFNSDKQGNIWIATDNGIIQFDLVTEKFKHFGFERGLQGRYFNYLNYKGLSGKLYFGGNGGVNIFDPASIKTNPHPPEMIFTGLKLDGKSIMPGKRSAIQKPIFAADKITVGPDVLTISIDFAAIHFAGNNDNKFQYKLEGFDKQWRDGGTVGNSTYTNLSPGSYTLYIKGSNWDGVWSDGKKSIEIIILPPWWRTWWAYSLYAATFFFLLWQFIRYQRIKTLRKERERSQQKELEQAKEIEKAYHELKATQQQLIQSEKMASLGELTAGIAHEIQNPLNFVNNFSEVNIELIEELKSEKSKEKSERDEKLEDELINNIAENEEKIIHHGKRADAIVKGMLQHTRNSTGIKEPTDINALCDEYLRLSYHGLRAKDKFFNASLKTDFDESIGNINIIPQDIGRVILNLINNAFYAVDEKKKQQPNFEPIVTVTTRSVKPPLGGLGAKVEIKVADNGSGVPQKVLDKIFQPFFTTKPTGQGTGLGLSLSYDIVKAHGGELMVETKEGEGSEFIIQLPINISANEK
jgi:signal transduction histidine kinase